MNAVQVKGVVAKRPIQIENPERIVVRSVNWLGDAVMTTPALQRLRQRFPSAQISLLVHEKLEELWRQHPSVNRVIPFGAREKVWSIARRIAREDFQLALILPNSPRSALEAWLARIPQRVGHARFARAWMLTHAVSSFPPHETTRKRSITEIKRRIRAAQLSIPSSSQSTPSLKSHHIVHYLQLTAALGANPDPIFPLIAVSSDEIAAARSKFGLKSESEGGQPILCLNPGAEYGPAKRWPVERFAAVTREIQKRTSCQWIILGGQGDVSLAAELVQTAGRLEPPALNLAGKTSLRELCAILKFSRLVLTNDTGPMHLAAAVGTPVVALFGSTSPTLTGPGLPGAYDQRLLTIRAPCSPCFRRVCPIDFRCMRGVSSDAVVDAVMSTLALV